MVPARVPSAPSHVTPMRRPAAGIDIFVPNVAVSPHFGRTIDTPARVSCCLTVRCQSWSNCDGALAPLRRRSTSCSRSTCGRRSCSASRWCRTCPRGAPSLSLPPTLRFTQIPCSVVRPWRSLPAALIVSLITRSVPATVYGITKTALVGLTKALGKELAHNGIRVNCICPGLIDTRFSSALTSSDEVVKEVMRNTFMGRVGEASECAGIVAFLSSSDASYITGESIVVAGGIPGRL